MNRISTGVLLPFVLAAAATAQTWTWSLDPRAAYVRTNNDSPVAPLVVNLGSLGIAAGDWLSVGSQGTFRYINGGQDNYRSLCAVFSSNATLLATNVQQRVPGAIAAGPSFPSGNTFSGSLPMDIPQDFFVSRNLWSDHVEVQVPAGATHLFIGVHDSLFNDNVDPNGDYGVVITKLVAPTFGGTGEHIEMKAAVNGTPARFPDMHLAPPGSTITTELDYPLGFIDGELYLFLADVTAIGAPVPNPLPGLYSQNLILLKAGVLPTTPNFTDTWTLPVAAGFAGTAVFVQCVALSSIARNGLFVSSNAHVFLFT